MKVIVSHPTGNQNSRNTVIALEKNNLLDTFYTSLGIYDDSILNKLNFGFFKDISRRSYSKELRGKIKYHPNLELLRLMAIKFKMTKFYKSQDSKFSVQNIFEDFDRFVAKEISKSDINLIYSYAGTSYHTFVEASRHKIHKIYEQHGCYWSFFEEIAKQEIQDNLPWANSINISLLEYRHKDRLELELEMADTIVVASKFCANSVPEHFKNKTFVIPYGFPKSIDNVDYKNNKRLKILFVGNLSQLKGLSYLFDAVDPYKNFLELSLIGSLPSNETDILNDKLKNHNYLGTMSHDKVLEQMRLHDLLLFPTLLDAFGMVISEAMSQGIPVITTENSAGFELIDHGKNGWVIPARSTEAIKEIIESILSNPKLTAEMGEEALKKSKMRSWDKYQSEIASFISKINLNEK